jgi:hypothetical protein
MLGSVSSIGCCCDMLRIIGGSSNMKKVVKSVFPLVSVGRVQKLDLLLG